MKVQTYEEIYGVPLTIRDLVNGFEEDTKTGKVVAFGGSLNVRPPYQREFVYGSERRNAVINTVLKGFPLNVMYWAKTDNGFELMDGQQRTISICKYFQDQFSIDIDSVDKKMPKTFSNLGSKKDAFLDYKLTVYICDGTEDEKMDWFQVINVAGIPLTLQEMRNAIYNGSWVTSAKRYFSRIDGEGYASEGRISNGHVYSDYLKVTGGKNSEKEDSVVRQRLLEIVLNWATDAHNKEQQLDKKEFCSLDGYMSLHRNDVDAKPLWNYFEEVMEWVKTTFPTYYDFMKGVEWGHLYNKYHTITPIDADKKVKDIVALAGIKDSEITNISGVFEAVLSGSLKTLNARAFSSIDRRKKFEEQKHTCPYCHKVVDKLDDMHGDHIKPWTKGGKTTYDNLQMLCIECNLKKSAYDVGYDLWDGKNYEGFNLVKWDNDNPAKKKK